MLIYDKINTNVRLLNKTQAVSYEVIKPAFKEVMENTRNGILNYHPDRHMFGTFCAIFKSELLIYLGFKGNPYKPVYNHYTATTVLSKPQDIFLNLSDFKPENKLITDIWFPVQDRESRVKICDYYLDLLNK